MRAVDTVARLGGDEFTVILETLSEDRVEATRLAEKRAEDILSVLNLPYSLAGEEHLSSTSIGITLFNHKELVKVNELLKRADIAMYKAKNDGRNAFWVYEA